MRMTDLDSLFRPRSVAVVGASDRGSSVGSHLFNNLREGGYSGDLIPVNPRYSEIGGTQCYARLSDVGRAVDCAALAVPAAAVCASLEDAAAAGVRAAVVLSSGFKESGPEGADREERLTAIARDAGIALLGPNCLGLVNFYERVPLSFAIGFAELTCRVGGNRGLAVVSQSGAIGTLMVHAYTRGVRFSHFVSTGNSPVIDVGDCVRYLSTRDEVTGFVVYYEGLHDRSCLLEAAELAWAADKPMVVVKAGTTQAGAAAIMSHTGSAVDDSRAGRAALESRGAVVVRTPGEALPVAAFLSKTRGRWARPARVALVSVSGGAGVLAADTAVRHRVELARFEPATVARLEVELKGLGSTANPVDLSMAGFYDGAALARTVEVLGEDPGVGAVVVLLSVSIDDEASVVHRPRTLAEAAGRMTVPLAVVWLSEWFDAVAAQVMEHQEGLGLFRDMDSCFEAIAAGHVADGRVTEPVPTPVAPGLSPGLADEVSSRGPLEAMGLPFAAMRHIPSVAAADVAVAMKGWTAFPVVLKIVSGDLPHKSRVGGVRLGLRSAEEVVAASTSVLADVAAAAPSARLTGFLVQEMLSATTEVLVGAYRDPRYGPVVAVGPGGTGADGRQEVGVAAAPLSLTAAARLVATTPGVSHLPSIVADALAHALVSVGSLIAADPSIAEIDVNPMLVCHDGRVLAVDSLIRAVAVPDDQHDDRHGRDGASGRKGTG